MSQGGGMADFFHMSPCLLRVGDVVRGNGRDKVDPKIEAALETARPVSAICRRDAVYCVALPDFNKCGIVSPGYIYRVTPEGLTERYDLAWIGPMQKALVKEKHGKEVPGRFADYPDWTDDLVASCCAGYWSGVATDDANWEHLAPALNITGIVADRFVDPSETKGGWKG